MGEINKLTSRIYSRLGQRGAIFGMAINDLAVINPKMIVLTADLASLSGMDRFQKTFPRQFVNVGIAEQNMLGVAAGMTVEGYQTIVTTYATFLTMRACEQIRHFMGYMNLPIVAVGSGAGLSQGFAGSTHYTIEDISILRAIPNIKILSPADAGSAVKLFELAIKENKPAYIRLTGGLNCPIIYYEDKEFSFGGSTCLQEGNDIAILATGTMVSNAFDAAKTLEDNGLSVKVVDMYSLKPIDKRAIQEAAKCKLIITVEEHNRLGGLGAIVAEELTCLENAPRLLRLGVDDTFGEVGDYQFLLERHRLTPQLITEDILKFANVSAL